jgi:hypothetical protein
MKEKKQSYLCSTSRIFFHTMLYFSEVPGTITIYDNLAANTVAAILGDFA